ncbi:hypothetical protein C7M84_003613 [Penaeus vannamei]|uniref:Uncharacterized protein n=1 Tax=Penaeus vannamei TaxID=6689 RepID=A0A423TMQ6_PENVA|nr:hypothetical protein C7M84_003613 [Penaeus vannamei]
MRDFETTLFGAATLVVVRRRIESSVWILFGKNSTYFERRICHVQGVIDRQLNGAAAGAVRGTGIEIEDDGASRIHRAIPGRGVVHGLEGEYRRFALLGVRRKILFYL